MANGFFGAFLDKIKFSDEKLEQRAESNQIATDYDDGAIQVDPDAISQFAMNLDWSYNSQAELIDTYREVAQYSLVDFAIEDIIGELVNFGEDDDPIELDLSDIEDEELSENLKEKFHDSYNKVARLLDLKSSIHKKAKQFYVDGRVAYQKVIDKQRPTDGLLKIIELDTRCVTKYRGIKYDDQTQTIADIEEYFIYDENPRANDRQKQTNNKTSEKYKTALRLDPKTITYVTSGLTDPKSGYAVSWLHKAVKPANQLRMMENALVIYRITRAPERRIFYVDTANLPKSKAESYLRSLKNSYRNRMSFDPESGTFKDTRHLQTMQEDYWLPRNSSGRGTEVSTLPGGQNLSDIDDVIYFQKQLYKALNIPISRLESDSMMPLGRAAEISRDELKFGKFVSKVRKRFNMILLDLLKTDLILTKVITPKEWDEIEDKINFKYAQDLYLEEMKQTEMLRDRVDVARDFQENVGKYFSHEYVRKEIFKQSDQDIEEQDKLIEKESKNKQFNPGEDEIGGGLGGLR